MMQGRFAKYCLFVLLFDAISLCCLWSLFKQQRRFRKMAYFWNPRPTGNRSYP